MRAPSLRAVAPMLSIVVVTHNSRSAVVVAFPPLCRQLTPEDELIVVDNASSDDTLGVVRELAPEALVVETGRNAGFAAGANAGARAARGDLLLFLNPDATPGPGLFTLNVVVNVAPAATETGVAAADRLSAAGGVVTAAGNPVNLVTKTSPR